MDLEPVVPEPGAFSARAMARGEPGVPLRFTWRGRIHRVAEVLDSRRETGACRNGSGERYVRRHVTRVRTTDGEVLDLSGSRGPAAGPRWFVRVADSPGPRPPA